MFIVTAFVIMLVSFKCLSMYWHGVMRDLQSIAFLGSDYYIFCGIQICLFVMWVLTTFYTAYVLMTFEEE